MRQLGCLVVLALGLSIFGIGRHLNDNSKFPLLSERCNSLAKRNQFAGTIQIGIGDTLQRAW